ncbi:UNVERIFIED_CONTAM: hypothetical protein HDU68_008938 [Siphonaria sp. JEL0065]|nr:hypothetical protein HDU68_008938 [Siphonaria sp. JEL0065]
MDTNVTPRRTTRRSMAAQAAENVITPGTVASLISHEWAAVVSDKSEKSNSKSNSVTSSTASSGISTPRKRTRLTAHGVPSSDGLNSQKKTYSRAVKSQGRLGRDPGRGRCARKAVKENLPKFEPPHAFFKSFVASISPVRLFQKRIDVTNDFEDEADDEQNDVVETVQFEYDDNEDNNAANPESPAEISQNALAIISLSIYSLWSDYVLTPISALFVSLLAFYNSLVITSRIGLLVIAISAALVLIVNQRSDLFPPSSSCNLTAYLPPALAKWGDVIVWPTFMDRNAPLVIDWYNTAIATNLDRLSNIRICIPHLFHAGDGEPRVAKRWNIFFPLRDTESTVGKAVIQPETRSTSVSYFTSLSTWIATPSSSSSQIISDFWNSTSSSIQNVLKAVKYMTFSSRTTKTSNPFSEESSKIDFKRPLPVDSAILDRVEHLEKVLVQIQNGFSKASTSFDGLTSNIQENQVQVASLREIVQTLAVRLEKRLHDLGGEDASWTSSLKALQGSLEALKGKVDGFVDASDKNQGSVEGQLKAVEIRVSGLARGLKDVEDKIVQQEESFHDVGVIGETVPSLMVARRVAKTGKVVLDPEFLTLLEGKPIQLSESRVQELIIEKLLRATNGLVSAAQVTQLATDLTKGYETSENVESRLASYATQGTVSQLSESLHKEIQAALESLASKTHVDSLLAEKSREFLEKSRSHVEEVLAGGPNNEPSKTILTHGQVMKILTQEIEIAKTDMETQFKSKLEQVNPANRARLDVEAMKSVMDALIENALTQYAADGIGREDYALDSNGAYVLQALTSAPYTVASETVFGRAMGHRQRAGFGPFIALTEGTRPGKCWAMNGTSGTLGINLASPIIPTSFTIDHVSKQVLLPPNNQGLKSSPKEIELWAVLGSSSDYSAFSRLNLFDTKTRSIPRGITKQEYPAGLLLSQGGTVVFDPVVANVQTFGVSKEAVGALVEAGIVPRAVVLRVVSNWGNDAFTCLYRVRVHGR